PAARCLVGSDGEHISNGLMIFDPKDFHLLHSKSSLVGSWPPQTLFKDIDSGVLRLGKANVTERFKSPFFSDFLPFSENKVALAFGSGRECVKRDVRAGKLSGCFHG
ncbi:MAG: hypothetical protein AAGJ50_05060, partial [Pseudomonadota bacterium]